ncbi:MAG: hypothetical protein LBG80_18470 [Bacteroidales bacterium]|jgi:hypothetical protein|nr:hypothetical protein [Bacteroidales bacterium]
MKKIFFLFIMPVSITATAQRTTPVTIANTHVDYSQKIVTFDLSWKGRDANHRDEVWVFVDIQPITGVSSLDSWSPATLVPSATTVTAGSGNQYSSLTYTVVSGNTRGVWVTGTATNTTSTFNATVKVTLHSGTPAKFNACAYVTDYPPNAAKYSDGNYTLKGTKPFTINNNVSVDDTKYSGVINSITDATGCPGVIGRDVPVNGGTCAPGLTAVNGYCRDLVADNAHVACGLELNAGGNTYSHLAPSYVTAGWRLPTYDEACCFGGGPGTWCIINNQTCHVPNCYYMGDVVCTFVQVR